MSFRRKCSTCGSVAAIETMDREFSHLNADGKRVEQFTCIDTRACEARSGLRDEWSEADEIDCRIEAERMGRVPLPRYVNADGSLKGRWG